MSPAELLEVEMLNVEEPYPIPPRGEDLPCDDGEPLETPWHRHAMNLLLETLQYHWRERTDFYAGGNMFIHFSLKRQFNKDFRGPDVFVVKGVSHEPIRKSWVVWEEDGRYPDVVVEILSESTAHIDRVVKKRLYQDTWKTAEYFCYDPDGPRIDGWRLIDNVYRPIEAVGGRLWSNQLELFLGGWSGKFMAREAMWPRWFDRAGSVIQTYGEGAAALAVAETSRAEAEKSRAEAAEAEVARLRAELQALRAGS